MPSIGNYFSARTQRRTGVASSALNLIGTFLESEINNQYRNARAAALKDIAEWNAALQDPANELGYDQWMASWRQHSEERREQIASAIKLPEAKQRFEADWAELDAEQTGTVASLARGRQQEVNVSNLNARLAEYVRLGQYEEIDDEIDAAVRAGTVAGGSAATAREGMKAQARYNDVYRQLDGMGDPAEAYKALQETDAPDRFGLTIEQIADMSEAFNGKAARKTEEMQREYLARAAQANDAFMQLWETDQVSDVREIRTTLDAVRGTDYEPGIRGILDKWNNVYGVGIEERTARNQQWNEFTLLNRMYAWQREGRQGDAPWTTDDLLQMFEKGQINDKQLATLGAAAEKAAEPDAVVDIRSRLYAAMESTVKDGKIVSQGPAWQVSIVEIDKAYADGQITIEQHRELLGLRKELQSAYESGLNKTEEQAEFDAATTVYDTTKTLAVREKWLRDNRSKFSNDDFAKWLGRLEQNAGSAVRESIFNEIKTLYREAMQGKTVEETKRLALLEYDAMNDMERYMVETANAPNKEALWNAKLHEMLGQKALEQLQARLLSLTGATRFPVNTTKAGRALELETAMEYGILGEYGKEAQEYEGLRGTVLEQERSALRGKRITPVSEMETPSGETVYTDAAGNRYLVRNRNVEGTVREVVYQLVAAKDENGNDVLKAVVVK